MECFKHTRCNIGIDLFWGLSVVTQLYNSVSTGLQFAWGGAATAVHRNCAWGWCTARCHASSGAERTRAVDAGEDSTVWHISRFLIPLGRGKKDTCCFGDLGAQWLSARRREVKSCSPLRGPKLQTGQPVLQRMMVGELACCETAWAVTATRLVTVPWNSVKELLLETVLLLKN